MEFYNVLPIIITQYLYNRSTVQNIHRVMKDKQMKRSNTDQDEALRKKY